MFCPSNNLLRATNMFSAKPATFAEVSTRSVLSGRLNDYALKSILGKGAFGSVLLAETTIDGESGQVAIKVVRRSGVTDVSLVTMIHEEQKLMRYFTTNNGLGYFPQLIESFYDEHNYYLVSEYISGGTLRDEMKRCGGRLPLSRVKFIMAQCMVIVGFMHEHGVMHRDIKPENILIDAVGNVVFTDLGLARRFCYVLATDVGVIVDGHVRTSVSGCGTPGYMAPEVILGERYSKQVDMYSLGCLMYEMVFGVLPFRQRNLNDLTSAVIEGSYKFPTHFNIDLMTLDMISGLLAARPYYRLTIEDAKRHGYFAEINWNLMANHKYELPTEWAPPLPRIDKSRAINKDMLVDRSLEFQEPICWPHDLQFIMLPHKPTNRRPASPHPEESRVDVGRKVMTLLDNARNRREITNRIAIEPPAVRAKMDDCAARHAQFSEFKHSILSVGEIVLPARNARRAAYVAIEPPLAPEHEFGQNLRDAIDRVMDEPVGMNYYDPIILTSTPAIDIPVVAVDEMHGIKRVQFSQMNRSMVLPSPSIDRSAYDAITSPPMPGREFEQNYMDCIDISRPSWMNFLNPPTRTPAIDIPVGGRRHAQYSEFGRSILSVGEIMLPSPGTYHGISYAAVESPLALEYGISQWDFFGLIPPSNVLAVPGFVKSGATLPPTPAPRTPMSGLSRSPNVELKDECSRFSGQWVAWTTAVSDGRRMDLTA